MTIPESPIIQIERRKAIALFASVVILAVALFGGLVKIGSAILGGGGGGKDDFAQGGGTEPEKLPMALSSIKDIL